MESKTVEATKRNEAKASFEALIGQFGPMLVDRGLTPPSLDDKDDAAAITMKARELGGHVVAMQVAISPTAPAPLSQPHCPSPTAPVYCLLSRLLCAHSQTRLTKVEDAEKVAARQTMDAKRGLAADHFERDMTMWSKRLTDGGFMDLPVVAEGDSLEAIQKKHQTLSLLVVQLQVRTTALPMPIRQP